MARLPVDTDDRLDRGYYALTAHAPGRERLDTMHDLRNRGFAAENAACRPSRNGGPAILIGP